MSSREQAMEALERANEVRKENAGRVVEIGLLSKEEGLIRVAEMLEAPDEYTRAIPVDRLLKGIHRFGESKTSKILFKARINQRVRVGRLTELQREIIAKELREYGSGRCVDCGGVVSAYARVRCAACYRAFRQAFRRAAA